MVYSANVYLNSVIRDVEMLFTRLVALGWEVNQR